jgi:hypothetical protein
MRASVTSVSVPAIHTLGGSLGAADPVSGGAGGMRGGPSLGGGFVHAPAWTIAAIAPATAHV